MNIDSEVRGILHEELQEMSVALLAPSSISMVPQSALQDCSRRLQRLAAMTRPLGQPLLLRAVEIAQRNVQQWARQGGGNGRHQIWRLIVEWPLEIDRFLDRHHEPSAAAELSQFLSHPEWLQPLTEESGTDFLEASEPESLEPTAIEPGDLSLELPSDVSQSLVVELLQELPDLTERLARLVENWSDNPEMGESLLEARRVAHTIKGAANVVGVRGIAVFTHLLEDVLSLPLNDNTCAPSLLLRACACLQQMTDALLNRDVAPAQAGEIAQALLTARNLERPRSDTGIELATKASRQHVVSEGVSRGAAVRPDAIESPQATGLRVDPLLVDDMFRLAGESSIAIHNMREFLQHSRQLAQGLGRRAASLRNQDHTLFAETDARSSPDLTGDAALRVQDLREAIADMQLLGEDLQQQFRNMEDLLTHQERLGEELRNRARQCRMLPAAEIAPRLRRGVTQASKHASKQVTLEMLGGDTLVDAHILNSVIEPLMHALRNAIDHGIESPAERLRLRKSEAGRITVSFIHEGSDVVIRCQDDGRGLDTAAIRRRAIDTGLIAAGSVLNDAQLARLVFEPGFSTRDTASQSSGRGIGMSAIAAQVAEMKGLIEIYSQSGQGCCIEFRVPESLLTVGGILIRLNDRTVGISSRGLHRVAVIEAAQIVTGSEGSRMHIDGDTLPVYLIEAMLYGQHATRRVPSFGQTPALIVRTGEACAVVIVESIVATRALVIRRPGHYLSCVGELLGTTTLTDGSIVAVLDLVELLRAPSNWRPAPIAYAMPIVDSNHDQIAWIVDDSAAVRKALAQQVAAAGYTIRIAAEAAEVLDQVRHKVPALVIIDAEMPGMSGVDLCARLRTDARLKSVPIVMLSARGDACHEAARTAGATLLLPKPCPRTLLQRMLERFPAPRSDFTPASASSS